MEILSVEFAQAIVLKFNELKAIEKISEKDPKREAKYEKLKKKATDYVFE